MGKIRTRFIGIEEVEEKEKKIQKEKSKEKKQLKGKIKVAEPKQIDDNKPIEEKEKKEDENAVKTIKAKTRGKNYLMAKNQIKTTPLSLKEAIELLKKIKFTKFDEAVELHIKVSANSIKGDVQMPNSIGKEVRVQIVDENTISQIEKGKIDFDVLISHPSFMPKIIKFAKILGPKGLMPNPKAGTVSDKPEEIAKKFKKGVLKWKSEIKQPLIHQQIAKLSNETKAIEENAKALLNSIGKNKIIDVYITSSMTPSIKIDIAKI